tara:strand:+ start:796 stop:954 length:159 start_codon:yes stop_codon:yes gene_type:complete
MKITRGRLKEIISEEIQIFVEAAKKELLSEGKVKPENLKKLLEQLTQENGDS